VVKTVNTPFADTNYTDATGSTTGESFSYRVCITDTSSKPAKYKHRRRRTGSRYGEPDQPDGFFRNYRVGVHGDIDISFTYPADTSDYDSVEIRRLAGSTAPAAACTNGDGSAVVKTYTSFTDNGTVNDTHSASVSEYPGVHSYRVCITIPA